MSWNIIVIIQSYGRVSEYLRTVFSVWSFYAHVREDARSIQTMIYTDAPEFFEDYLAELPVVYVKLTPEWMKEVRGQDDFLHRMKIAIIEDAFQRSTENVMYVDSDTFFVADPSPYFKKLRNGLAFMHTREYEFRSLLEMPLPSGAPFHAVVKRMEEGEFTMANRGRRKFDIDLFSWNAGVIMLHRSDRSLLPDVFAVTDQLYASTRNHASEQYAFSLVLQTNSHLESCESVLYHYWYRIKKQIADEFLARKIGSRWKKLKPSEKVNEVVKWTRHLPEFFEGHMLTARDNAIQAFHRGAFATGYFWAFKTLIKNPVDLGFIRDVGYHTRRLLQGSAGSGDSIKVGFCIAYDWPLLAYSLPLIYASADLICLSVDEDHCSWAKKPFDWDEQAFNSLIRSIDVAGKIRIYKDNFHLETLTPSENEVRQRKMMSDQMGAGGWHIQLDCDEYFIEFGRFVSFLKGMRLRSYEFNVCCQWITLFKQVDGGFLYVFPEHRRQFEFMQIASRTPRYEYGRRNRNFNIESHFFIVHQSWARSEKEIADKLSNWGHVRDFNIAGYFEFWLGATRQNYHEIRNFHPVKPESWPALRFIEADSVAELIARLRQQAFPTHTVVARMLKNSLFVSRLRRGIGSLCKMFLKRG